MIEKHIWLHQYTLLDLTANCFIQVPRFQFFMFFCHSVVQWHQQSFCVQQISTYSCLNWPKKARPFWQLIFDQSTPQKIQRRKMSIMTQSKMVFQFWKIYSLFILLLVVANFANTKIMQKTYFLLKPWHVGTYLRVLSKSYLQMNTNMIGF